MNCIFNYSLEYVHSVGCHATPPIVFYIGLHLRIKINFGCILNLIKMSLVPCIFFEHKSWTEIP